MESRSAQRTFSPPEYGIRRPRGRELRRDMTFASGLNVIAGLWLLASPLAIGYASAARLNAVLVGAAVALLACLRMTGAAQAPAFSWLNMLLGVWLVASPFALATGEAALWNFLIVGWSVAFWAFFSAISSPARLRREPG